MRICVFASGSSGNCLLAAEGDTNILIDVGISMRRVTAALTRAGLSAEKIDGVLVTHEHSDHISGLKMLAKHYKLPVYAPRTVANRLLGMIPELDGLLHIIPAGEPFRLKGISVLAFHTSHDTDESVGYRLDGRGSFALATDTGCITEEMRSALTGAGLVMLEANHDVRMLKEGNYPYVLKRRILSERGHLSNDCCAELAAELAQSGTREIILGHISRENNRPELAMAAVRAALPDMRVGICCAPPQGFLEFEVEGCLV